MKNKFINKLRIALLWLWQLPQHLIALFVCLIFRVKPTIEFMPSKISSSFSLGEYIFLDSSAYKSKQVRGDYGWAVIIHELGHTIQSRYLGWLWIIIIGIPSAFHWIWYKFYGAKHGANYYSFYTEKWADELGGVYRDL